MIDSLGAEGTITAISDGSTHRISPVAITVHEGEALRDRVIAAGAARTIEIGLGYGVSALYICEGLLTTGAPDARHVVIDPHQESRFRNCGVQVLEQAGVAELVELHQQEAEIVLPRLLDEDRRFDFAMVDGNHRFDTVFVDLFYLSRLLRPGGVVFVDDYQLRGVARATGFFVTNLEWELESASPADEHHQWVVLRTAMKPDTRPFTYFVDF
jgi:predicted O-methyltransferase YrrM